MIEKLPGLFERELNKLIEELNLYRGEEGMWVVKGQISNSAGNLCLHMLGNLNHFIGAVLGNTGYVRKRDDEFSLKNVPKAELIETIKNTIRIINIALQKLTEADMNKLFPLEKHGEKVTTGYMLIHLLTHLNYHLGQVNYHRRLTQV